MSIKAKIKYVAPLTTLGALAVAASAFALPAFEAEAMTSDEFVLGTINTQPVGYSAQAEDSTTRQGITVAVTDKPAGTADRAVMSGLEPGQSSRVRVVQPASDGSAYVEVFRRVCDPATDNGQESCPISGVVAGNTVVVDVFHDSSWQLATELLIPADVDRGETVTTSDGNSFTFESPHLELARRSDGQIRAQGYQFDPHASARITIRRNGTHVGNHFGVATANGRVNTSGWNLSNAELQPGDLVQVFQRRMDGPGGSYIEPDHVFIYEFTYCETD